jgi:hypothetical protein
MGTSNELVNIYYVVQQFIVDTALMIWNAIKGFAVSAFHVMTKWQMTIAGRVHKWERAGPSAAPARTIIAAGNTNQTVRNIRFGWDQMKRNDSIKNAVQLYAFRMTVLFWIPLVLVFYSAIHKLYGTFPEMVGTLLATIIVLIVVFMMIYHTTAKVINKTYY